ncbi:ribonuclease J [Inquilinus sp. CAU 1745]|uniref:ribonuclease J n=1 Tax=Inquilinus sp. CAU 1745 TaxID=3140369 RepID=UPI00325BA4E2
MTHMDGGIAPLDGLHLLPLGGSEEIGMNLYLYGLDGKWLIVDLGITFGDESTPGIDVLMPDPSFIVERRKDLVGLVLTHAHEDHFGAIQYLWPRLKCPIYATPFTAALLRLKLAETDFAKKVKIIEVPLSGRQSIGPFDVEFVTVTHSVPEPNALVLRTPHGLVVHSGDWKLDPEPLVGEQTDERTLRRLGDEGVLALVCDSTNALEPGRSGSEGEVRRKLTEAIGGMRGRIAVTCFSTNVARIQTVAEAAHANGRQCALIGRSLWRVHEAAKQTGYLDLPEPFLTEAEAAHVPPDQIVMVCTGSQGEPRSALARIARDDHNHIVLEKGDTVIFSAREIPGNEKAIGRVQSNLARLEVEIITPDEAMVHVSGHPAREELTEFYQWLRPRISVPVHGTPKHLQAHARLADACQVPEIVIPHDGAIIRLEAGKAGIVDEIEVRRLALDGSKLIRLDNGVVKSRHRMNNEGVAVATLVLDRSGELLADPQISLIGLEDDGDEEDKKIALMDRIEDAVDNLSKAARKDDEAVREAARLAVRRTIRMAQGKKPMIDIQLVRID